MKTALLIPCEDTINKIDFWVWETSNEKTISNKFSTREQALKNRPQHFKCRDDAWNLI